MTIADVIGYLQEEIPEAYQESYDNCGLLVGHERNPVTGVLITVDVTEAVVEEAFGKGCNLIISHHPLIFKGLKRLVGKGAVERIVEMAIKKDIAIFAAHTNLDSVDFGVSYALAQKIGLQSLRVLSPRKQLLQKLVTFCPHAESDVVRNALFSAGAGHIGNYDSCSYNVEGWGSFRANFEANPFVGKPGELHREQEMRIETIFPAHMQAKVIAALCDAHPYEEVAYDIYPLENVYDKVGYGMIGKLHEEMFLDDFLHKIKADLDLKALRYTNIHGKKIKHVALCGGSGAFLIGDAYRANADVYISGDLKYHDFFEGDHKMVLVDVGHYESEKYTKDILLQLIKKKFINFVSELSEVNTNPINYL